MHFVKGTRINLINRYYNYIRYQILLLVIYSFGMV